MQRTSRRLVRSTFSKSEIGRARDRACSPAEALESRMFLSGDVLASVVNGSVILRGDAEANAIVMDAAGLNADQVRVTGAGGVHARHQQEAAAQQQDQWKQLMAGARHRQDDRRDQADTDQPRDQHRPLAVAQIGQLPGDEEVGQRERGCA